MQRVQGVPRDQEGFDTEETDEQDVEDMTRFLRGGARGPLDHRAVMLN